MSDLMLTIALLGLALGINALTWWVHLGEHREHRKRHRDEAAREKEIEEHLTYTTEVHTLPMMGAGGGGGTIHMPRPLRCNCQENERWGEIASAWHDPSCPMYERA